MKPVSTLLIFILFLLFQGCAGPLSGTGNDLFVNLSDEIIQDSSSGLMWQKKKSSMFSSLEEAKEYVDNLNLGGYTDWRLPTNDELYDLYFLFDFGPARESEYGYLIQGNYWVADEDNKIFVGAWKDKNMCEIDRHFVANVQGAVRAVRP